MNREVCFFLLIIQSLTVVSQSTPISEISEKELDIRGIVMKGFETQLEVPAEFIKRDLWREGKKVATVEQISEHLRMKFELDNGETLVVYGQTLEVQENVGRLTLVSESSGVEAYLRLMLLDLRTTILINYLQDAITKAETRAASISAKIAQQPSESVNDDLWRELDSIRAELVVTRSQQQKLLSGKQ